MFVYRIFIVVLSLFIIFFICCIFSCHILTYDIVLFLFFVDSIGPWPKPNLNPIITQGLARFKDQYSPICRPTFRPNFWPKEHCTATHGPGTATAYLLQMSSPLARTLATVLSHQASLTTFFCFVFLTQWSALQTRKQSRQPPNFPHTGCPLCMAECAIPSSPWQRTCMAPCVCRSRPVA